MTPDPMSEAAHHAAMTVSGMDYRLHFAADMALSRPERAAYLATIFHKWRALCEAMKALEDLAPNAAQRGYEAHQRARDFTEARQVAA